MQVVGVLSAALVMAPILTLLLKAYGIGPVVPDGGDPSNVLEAPQASLMAAVAGGVFEGGLPWGLIVIGMAVAAAIIVADVVLERRASNFRMPVLAVAVGIYLPLELSVPILAGGLISWAVHRHWSRRTERMEGELQADMMELRERGERRGMLLAAGLITGEALLGILLAIPIVLANMDNEPGESIVNPLEITADFLPQPIVGVLLCIVVVAVLARMAGRATAETDD